MAVIEFGTNFVGKTSATDLAKVVKNLEEDD